MSRTREELTHETMVRQGLSSRRPMAVTDAVRSVLALQAQEPAAPYLALWNRIEGFDPSELDRAWADGTIVKASLFRFTLHAVVAADIPWARAAMQSRRDAGFHGILDDNRLTWRASTISVERLATMMQRRVTPTPRWRQLLTELVPGTSDHGPALVRAPRRRLPPRADGRPLGVRPTPRLPALHGGRR